MLANSIEEQRYLCGKTKDIDVNMTKKPKGE
jgi:hypothetical protein